MSQLHGTLRKILAAGKVTVGLASHWPRITDISGSPPTGSRPRRVRWAPAYSLLVVNGWLYLTFILRAGSSNLWDCRSGAFHRLRPFQTPNQNSAKPLNEDSKTHTLLKTAVERIFDLSEQLTTTSVKRWNHDVTTRHMYGCLHRSLAWLSHCFCSLQFT